MLNEMTSLSSRIAKFALTVDYKSIPAEVKEYGKTILTDVFGVALTCPGLGHANAIKNTIKELGSSGPCTLWTSDEKVNLADAVMYNSCLIHGVDYDDTHIAGFVHPSAPVVSTAISCGEAVHATGQDIYEAILVGWEIIIRLGIATKGRGDDVGFHTTGLIAPFACACVVGRLMKVSQDVLTNALGLCGSQAGALQEFLNSGAQVKKLHPGWGAHCAVYSVLLAKNGLSGPPKVFEGNFGLWQTHFGGVDGLEEQFADLGKKWHVCETAFKMYPICHDTHSFVDCVIRLMEREDFSADDVAHVECRIEPRCYPIVCAPVEEKTRPKNDFIMRFSLQYVVAIALLYKCVTPNEINMKLACDPHVIETIDKIECIPDPEKENPGYLPGWVKISLKDGREFEEEQLYEAGTPQNPIAPERVVDKYYANMLHFYSREQADRILDLINAFEKMDDASELLEVIKKRIH